MTGLQSAHDDERERWGWSIFSSIMSSMESNSIAKYVAKRVVAKHLDETKPV
jgi:hypothetical protein